MNIKDAKTAIENRKAVLCAKHSNKDLVVFALDILFPDSKNEEHFPNSFFERSPENGDSWLYCNIFSMSTKEIIYVKDLTFNREQYSRLMLMFNNRTRKEALRLLPKMLKIIIKS